MKVLFFDFIQNVSKAKCLSTSSELSQNVVISFEKKKKIGFIYLSVPKKTGRQNLKKLILLG